MNATRRLVLDIPLAPYLQDHRFEGTAVLPAVEIMGLLAEAAARKYPGAPITRTRKARFHRFLKVPPQARRMAAVAAITPHRDGGLHAVLETRLSPPKTTIRRTLRHAELCFGGDTGAPPPPFDAASSLAGERVELAADRVYPDLVGFGPAFQNLRGRLELCRGGVLARVTGSPRKAGAAGAGTAPALGAVFPLDAALQAACIWGQRFRRVVAFPAGIEKRTVLVPTVPGETYLARVLPQRADTDGLYFDIWIYDRAGRPREAALGVHMQDLSRGRLRPPPWIAALKPGACNRPL